MGKTVYMRGKKHIIRRTSSMERIKLDTSSMERISTRGSDKVLLKDAPVKVRRRKMNQLVKDEVGKLGIIYKIQKEGQMNAYEFMKLNELEMRASKKQRITAYNIAGYAKDQIEIMTRDLIG